MPGDPLTTVAFAAGEEAALLVRALADLTGDAATDFALVGGLAVAARLSMFHRATQDLDALTTHDRDSFTDAVLATIVGASSKAGNLYVDDVRVDVIDVDAGTTYAAIAALAEPLDQLFTAAHLFAHQDSAALTLTCGDLTATVPVASARALLFMKLHAFLNPQRDTAKHSSDALDVYRLGSDLVANEHRPLTDHAIPSELCAIVTWALRNVRDRPDELTRRLAGIGIIITADQAVAITDLLIEDLRR